MFVQFMTVIVPGIKNWVFSKYSKPKRRELSKLQGLKALNVCIIAVCIHSICFSKGPSLQMSLLYSPHFNIVQLLYYGIKMSLKMQNMQVYLLLQQHYHPGGCPDKNPSACNRKMVKGCTSKFV